MFQILQKNIINIQALGLQGSYQVTKAKKTYLKGHNECAICGSLRGLEVHHRLPVHLHPDLACNPDNFITLCDGNIASSNSGCHYRIGHLFDFKTRYNAYIFEYAIASRFILERAQPDRIFIIPTKQMIDEFATSCNISTDNLLNNVNMLMQHQVLTNKMFIY